tara:strand:- start:326 stop:2017 length:1692 start_codon:yes stop_codon:yes gene_type:complete
MKKNNILLAILFAMFFSSFSQETRTLEVNEIDKKFINFYFQAEKHKLLEEYNQALELYEKCISLLPDESSPYYQISKLYLYLFQDIDNAKYYINQAISLDPENEWYYYELLSIYNIENDLGGQLNTHYKLIEFNSGDLNYYLDAINILIKTKDYREALKLIKKTEKKLGFCNELLIAKKDIYLKQNNLKEAEKIGKQLSSRSPAFFYVLAEIYMHFNDYENAIQAYKMLLETDPNNAKALIALHSIYLNKEDVSGQEKYLIKIADSDQINIEIKKEIFYNLLRTNKYHNYPSFKIIIEKAISVHSKEPLFHLILGDISFKEGNFKEAITHYYSALNSGIIKDEYIYTKLIEIHWQEEKTDSILQVTKIATERFPFTPIFYYYQGIALSNRGEYKSAIEALFKGKEYIFDNDPLISDFYSLIGNSYHELNNNASSDEAYENALKYNPNNTYVLNNYSYYLSRREEKLLLAKEMIVKCISLTIDDPNPSFLDTYAWVLYKLGEHDLAKTQIEKALELNSGSAVIFDHYGDILYSLGLLNQAREQWKRAHHLDEENESIKKKLHIE